MPDFGLKPLAAGLMVAAAVFGGCGNDSSKNELSSATATSLRSTLDRVEQQVDSRDCTGASQQAAAFRQKVDALPQRVDAKLRTALTASATRLETLVANQCTPAAPAEQAPTGATSQGQVDQPQNEKDQSKKPKKDKQPKQEKAPKKDQTQTEPPPDTGGAGQEVPPVDGQGGGATP